MLYISLLSPHRSRSVVGFIGFVSSASDLTGPSRLFFCRQRSFLSHRHWPGWDTAHSLTHTHAYGALSNHLLVVVNPAFLSIGYLVSVHLRLFDSNHFPVLQRSFSSSWSRRRIVHSHLDIIYRLSASCWSGNSHTNGSVVIHHLNLRVAATRTWNSPVSFLRPTSHSDTSRAGFYVWRGTEKPNLNERNSSSSVHPSVQLILTWTVDRGTEHTSSRYSISISCIDFTCFVAQPFVPDAAVTKRAKENIFIQPHHHPRRRQRQEQQ